VNAALHRRRWLVAAGAAAAAGGAGFAWWHGRGGGSGGEALDPSIWSLRFDAPNGPPIELARFKDKPLLLNFWATWCPPCVREMPALDRFHREFSPRGWQVLGLAADKPEPVREFLARTPVGYSIGLVGFAGIDLSRRLGNLSGGLPFTVLIDRRGRVAHRHSGETHFEQLASWAAGIS
jgi:thiol-disulfide isomerase/thioredoxin